MPIAVHIESTFELPFRRQEIWPILSKTDWINRSVGLPSVNYDIQPLPEGGSAVTARAKLLGIELTWRELPFEWLEPAFYRVHRIFISGPLTEGRMGLDFTEPSENHTRIYVYSDLIARSAVGAWFARNILGPKTNRSMRQIMEHVSEHLRGRKRVALPNLPKQAVAEPALQNGLQKLRKTVPDPVLITQMEALLRESADVELVHIRPFALARNWRREKWEVLRLFLQATRCGLLNFSWEILCPNCRSSRQPPGTSLAQVQRMSHCEVCQIKFDAEFDKSVELKFAVNPTVRPQDQQTFCLAGPGGKPHIVSQLVLAPEQQCPWKLPDLKRPYRLRSPQIKSQVDLGPDGAERLNSARLVTCRPDQFEILETDKPCEKGAVLLSNPNSFPIQLSLEDVGWSEDILTAAQVTNWQEFRDLFDTEVISPNEQITVGSQIVLFTDLRGSTALYNGIGDAPAYALVRNHFYVLTEAIQKHHGAIVKTIGDAVMAVFSRVDEALAAVKQMHDKLPAAVEPAGSENRLLLKSSLHLGACLAVNANDKLDFFGTTINLAARMVGCCQGGDLTVSDDLYQRPETTQFFASLGRTAEPSEVKFRGFETAHKVWRISMV